MAARRSASLRRRFPRRVDVPFLLLLSGTLLGLGLTTPALETKTLFWKDEYSILLNVRQMSRDDRHAAATIVALCSVGYPAAKLALLTFFWLFPFPATWRWRSIQLLRLLNRWAMVDVITIASIVVASLTIGPLEARPRIGLFLYAAGILCLMFVALLMDRMARCRR